MDILIVDDSALLRNILKQVLAKEDGISIAGEASNGVQAVELAAALSPDLVIMDIDMPLLDGIAATAKIMSKSPVPILILSSVASPENVFKALRNGALEVMKKPSIDQFNNPEFFAGFIEKLKTLSHVSVEGGAGASVERHRADKVSGAASLFVMGASTGGPVTLAAILSRLSSGFPAGIALVQHLEAGFENGFVSWLAAESGMCVRLAAEGDYPAAGEVLLAPPGRHLVFASGRLAFEDSAPVVNQKPSVNRLFVTAAECFRGRVAGVLLTGMGSDGADGCVEIIKRGGTTIVQDEATATVFGMPRAAIEKGGAGIVLPKESIADYMLKLAMAR